MKTEKIIRAQARESLKGNLTAAVSGVFVLLGVIMLCEIYYELLLALTGIWDGGDKIKSGNELTLIIILCSTFLITFALSPFKNGYIRLCYNIACCKGDGLRDVFYFFSGIKRYFKALRFNIIILLKKLIYALIGFIPYLLLIVLKVFLFASYANPANSIKTLFGALETVFLCIGIAIALILSVRVLVSEFVFADNHEANVFNIAKIISKNHLNDYYRLIFTFLLWILSCFFVLPGFYVIPYFTTSLGTTSKWLINLYKEGKTV